MENRAARVCELCGEQYPPHVLECLQDGEPTVAATTAHVQASKSPAMLLGSFFAPDDLDSRATSHALAPIKVNDDDLIEELAPEAEEESSSTRRALKAVDFAGLRKSPTPVYEPADLKVTSFALKPVRDTIPPVLDNTETALVAKSKRSPSLATEPEVKLLHKNSALPESQPGTTRNSAATDPGIEVEGATKAKIIPSRVQRQSDSVILRESGGSIRAFPDGPPAQAGRQRDFFDGVPVPEAKPPTPKQTPSLPEPFAAKKPSQATVPDIDILPVISKSKSSNQATVSDIEAPRLLKTLPPSTHQLKPIDPRAIDDWKIEKPLPSKMLKSIPLAQTVRRPFVTKRYLGAALLLVLVGGVFYSLWSLLGHTVDKKEQLASLAPVQARVEISLRSTPSGARVSGTINGEPFSPRFSPGSLTAPKDAEVKLTFEYANYAPSNDQFIADAPRDLSVHLSLLPTDPSTRPQQVATNDPKETQVAPPPKTIKSARPGTKTPKTIKTVNSKPPPTNTGKRPPLPATPEL